ncbi:MAG TPA: geranylgeranyl reductase family protein [Anaerolineae bacterium]|nr:geranylgeranyl reductase family protein [Anaerolineae bacterium]
MVTADPKRCAYCGGCVSVCPQDAIELAETRLSITEDCIECGLCVAACPVGALRDPAEEATSWTEWRFEGRYDMVVVGAGPAGSVAAWTAARLGLSVLLLEKRQEIGSPVRCAEGVPHEALCGFLEPDPTWISAAVDRAEIVAVANGCVEEHWQGTGGQGYILERRVFDWVLAERAAQAGADVRVKTPVTGLLRKRGAVKGVVAEWQGQRYEVQASIVVGADGVESRVGTWAGLDTHLPLKDTMTCAQYLLAGIDWDPACLGYWIDESVAPGGYAWVFPKGQGRANVGLGVQADLARATPLTYLDRFIERERALTSGSPVSLVAGNVSVAPPCRRMVGNGLMIVGDAARQVDPLTGGGIINAMTSGRIAAQVAAQALQAADVSASGLVAYQVEAERVLGRRLLRSYRLRERFPPGRRTHRSFVRLFAVAAGGK